MRITKSQLIENIKAGNVSFAHDQYLLTIATGQDKGIHRITESRIDSLGSLIGVEGNAMTNGPRKLFIR